MDDELAIASEELAEVFDGFADTVRVYQRAHWDELSGDQQADLQERINHFEDLSERFAADAIQEELAKVRSQVQDLRTQTAKAKQALKTLTRIQDVTKIVGAVLAAAEAAACGDLGGTADKLADLAGMLIPAVGTATAQN
jgi:DNA repair exonuclease SbcCD ATPase subunit